MIHPFACNKRHSSRTDTLQNRNIVIIETKELYRSGISDPPRYYKELRTIKDKDNNILSDSLTITILANAYKRTNPPLYIIRCRDYEEYDGTTQHIRKTKLTKFTRNRYIINTRKDRKNK
jgi:hypothetical protein